MTELLEKAFAKASKLTPQEQDLLAGTLLDELASEQLWDRAFAQSQDELAQLADEALAESVDHGAEAKAIRERLAGRYHSDSGILQARDRDR